MAFQSILFSTVSNVFSNAILDDGSDSPYPGRPRGPIERPFDFEGPMFNTRLASFCFQTLHRLCIGIV